MLGHERPLNSTPTIDTVSLISAIDFINRIGYKSILHSKKSFPIYVAMYLWALKIGKQK